MSEVTIQLDERQLQVLEEVSAREHLSKSELVARLLNDLDTPSSAAAPSEPRELTMEAWLDQYCGIVKDAPPDLSTNPTYLEGFGKV
jgi:hypothetical protein